MVCITFNCSLGSICIEIVIDYLADLIRSPLDWILFEIYRIGFHSYFSYFSKAQLSTFSILSYNFEFRVLKISNPAHCLLLSDVFFRNLKFRIPNPSKIMSFVQNIDIPPLYSC